MFEGEMREHGDAGFGDACEHVFEEGEGFLTEFVERVTLSVCAKSDSLSKVVEMLEMFFPEEVEDLEHDGEFDVFYIFFVDAVSFF